MFLLVMCLSGIFMFIELTKVKKYTSWYFALIPLFLLFSMMGFNRANRDYPFYEKVFFDEIYRSNFEFGYGNLVRFISYLGMDHTAIVFLVGSIFLLVLLKLLKTSNHVNLVIFFYSAFPLIYDINQTRNTLMYLIIVFSLVYIVNKKKIQQWAMWLIAFSLHKYALMYLPFYFLVKKNRKQYISLLRILTLLFFIFSPFIMKGASLLFPDKMGVYLMKTPDFGVITFFVYAIVDIFTVWWIDKRITKRLREEDKNKMEVLYRFVWFPILILPFVFYFTEISRMQRNAILVKYIYCALAMKYLNIKEKIITVLLLFTSVIIYISVLMYGGQLELFNYLNDNFIKYYLDKYLF